MQCEKCKLCNQVIFTEDFYEVYHKIPGLGVVCDSCYCEVEETEYLEDEA